LTKHVLNHWVSGKIYPHPHALLRLCRARGVDFNFLFLGDWSRLPHDVAARLDEAMRDHAAQVSAQAAA
jgi:hypothetical protein